MSLRRVVITGSGAMCGLGQDVETVWKNALDGMSGISSVKEYDEKMLPVPFGGYVKDFHLSPDILEEKEHKKFDRFVHFALHSTAEALANSNYKDGYYQPEKIGCILGTGLGGFPAIEKMHETYLERGSRRVSPFFIPSMIPNMASGLVSMKWNFLGINHAISSACASSAHAVNSAYTEIALGRQDMMVAGGAEAVISGFTISGFNSMKALAKKFDDPTKASRPFDKDRAGFVMGEGAGILVLESLEDALKRGAPILAEVVGTGASADAHHITSPHPEGRGAISCMKMALDQAGIKPEEVDYINAHGTSTPYGDAIESEAIKTVFGDHAFNLNVSSTKSMTGHLLGAAGGLETVFCLKAIETSTIPPTINLDEPDERCDLNYTAHKPQTKTIRYALNNSFGFGGTNCCTIFKKFEK